MHFHCRYAEHQFVALHATRRELADASPDLPHQDFPDTFGCLFGTHRQRALRTGRPLQTERQLFRERPQCTRQSRHRQGSVPPCQHHRLEELQHAKRLPIRHEDVHGASQCAGDRSCLRRTQSQTADVLLLEALLQRPRSELFQAARGRSVVMNGFELILPFLKPIEHLILDESVSEVMVNGPDHVFVEKAGYLQEVPDVSLGERSLLVAVKNIARRLGDDISEVKPILDSRLPDGSRVAAVIPPCSLGGITLTIRKFSSRLLEMEDLIRAGALDRALANRLEDYVLSRKNLLISGGTGAGKTTLAASLGRFIPPDERLLLIEDTAEIQLPHHNQVRFEARREQNGLPAISIRDLLKASLRHRPDRIILGEVRGGEAFDLLQLLNTGHSGTLSTIHANSTKQALSRFTSAVLQSGIELPYRAIKGNVADSLHVVVQVERRPGRRFISEVLELNSYDADADLFDYCVVYAAKQDPS